MAEAEALKYGNRVDRQEYGSIEVSRTSKVSIPADGENVRQQFSLKAPVEEKNLLALHNLTEKNLLGRQHTPNFNPRPPRGGRLSFSSASICCLLFQSTPPARGTTAVVPRRPPVGIISIHAPARGTTLPTANSRPSWRHFNPRPREGDDSFRSNHAIVFRNFNPRPREGDDDAA